MKREEETAAVLCFFFLIVYWHGPSLSLYFMFTIKPMPVRQRKKDKEDRGSMSLLFIELRLLAGQCLFFLFIIN